MSTMAVQTTKGLRNIFSLRALAVITLACTALLAYPAGARAQNPDLTNGLISHWKLDEASGARQDSKGTNHLTDNNTVTQQSTGKLGGAARFTRVNSEWLSVADNASFPKGDQSFTMAVWINMASRDSHMGIMGKLNSIQYGIHYDPGAGTGQLLFKMRSAADNVIYSVAGAAPASNTWYLVMAWHDAAANTINIQVNDGAVYSLAVPDGGMRSDLSDPFELGRFTSQSNFYYDGLMDSASLWGRALTAAERADLYNGGAGKDPTSTVPPVNNGWVISGQNVLFSAGNVGINVANPSARLHVDGDGLVTGNFTVDGNITAKYQDVAEWVPSTQRLLPGTVVVLDPRRANHVLASTSAYDTRVAGVVSAQPGIALGAAGEGKALVATTGRVKVRVDATRAPVRIGDLLVTSDVEGVAMRSRPLKVGGRLFHAPGTIIGKALEPLEKGTGEILVLLNLQ